MKYLVMECHTGYAVLLDEEGRFCRAANPGYEVGQTVEDPVLMREELAAGTLREIPVEGFAETREISVAVRRGRSDYAPLERFLDFCQEQSAQF